MDARRVSEIGREVGTEPDEIISPCGQDAREPPTGCRRSKTMNENYAELMTTFPLFEGFTVNGTRRLLDSGQVKELAPGELLLQEGDEADFAALVLTGKIEVFVERNGKDFILTEAAPGSILGELALLCGIPRSASARAKENSTVLEWTDETLRTSLLRDRSLAQRIFRQTLRTLVDKERELVDSLTNSERATA